MHDPDVPVFKTCHQDANGHPRCLLEARHLGSHIPIVNDVEDAAQRLKVLKRREVGGA